MLDLLYIYIYIYTTIYVVCLIQFRNFLQIDGTIVAPDEPSNWDPKLQRTWLEFSKLEGIVFQGNGVIDGSGSKWWAASCKKNKSNVLSSIPKIIFLYLQNIKRLEFSIRILHFFLALFQPCKSAPTVRNHCLHQCFLFFLLMDS